MGQLGNREAGQGRRSYGAQQDEAGTGKGHGCTRELYARFHVDESGTHRRVSAPCLSGRLGEGAARVQGPECTRSEERRVGKECRSRGWRYDENKNKGERYESDLEVLRVIQRYESEVQ